MAAAVRLTAVWAVAAATLWLHAMAGIPGDYLGQGYPLYPGLKVSSQNLLTEAALYTLPIALACAVALWLHVRLWALPAIALLWVWAASLMISPFAIDFGTTWTATEPLRELFLHPLHTPLALAALMAASWLALSPRPASDA